MTRKTAERLPGLDVLRGLAALAVVLFHFTTRFELIWGHPAPPPFLFPWGQRGVEVFFVISGFAIELSLERKPTAREFLRARAIRLYPTFWAALGVTLAVVGTFGLPERNVSLRDAALNFTMIPGSLGAHEADAVYWTLERELRFYGLVFVLLALGLRRYTLHAVLVTVGIQALGTVTHAVPHPVGDLVNGGFAHLFASGVVLARFRHSPFWKGAALLVPCLVAGLLLGGAPFWVGSGAALLVWIAARPWPFATLRPLLFLGRISYPLYLVHQYVGYVAMRGLYARGVPPTAAILAATTLGVTLAWTIHVLVEDRSLRGIRRMQTCASS